jgi:atypical dual specificity phosphatase
MEITQSMSAVARLSSQQDFSHLTCRHEDATFTVLRIESHSRPTLICAVCYLEVAQKDLDDSRSPLTPGQCGLCCRAGEVRRSLDLEMDICDICSEQNAVAQRKCDENYTPRPDIVPDKVLTGVFIGSKDASFNRETLRSLGISNILICCDSLPAYHYPHDPTMRYHRIPIKDSLFQSLEFYLPSALAFISQAIMRGEGCLVHCNAGVSRSGVVIVEYVRRVSEPKLSVQDALQFAKLKRPAIFPNSNFLRQLTEVEARGDETDS